MKILCIKDGFMQDQRRFCFKDKFYTYKKYANGYLVNSEIMNSHSMRKQFFDIHFQPENSIFSKDDELFEI